MSNVNKKILLVEDDSFLLNLYADKFRSEHYEVVVAENGEKAIKLANEHQPDIVLLDVLLPKKNGFSVLEELKSNIKTKKIPVILLTNLSQQEDIKKGIKLGAIDFLIKAHFMPDEVVNKIKKIIGN